MARIRTIKPEFFRHERLFEAERESGLPLRLAFAGLWTTCDREGRFAWRPRQLKLDCLPYDELDFSRVLDALTTRGFLVRYRVTDENGAHDFGFIPSWRKHQVINPRERDSELPDPDNCEILQEDADASGTREPRDSKMHVHARGERERERELEGKGTSTLSAAPTARVQDEFSLTGDEHPPPKANGASHQEYPDDFEGVWHEYRVIGSPNSSKAAAFKRFSKLSPEDRTACYSGLISYVLWLIDERKRRADYPAKHLATFITERGWEPFLENAA